MNVNNAPSPFTEGYKIDYSTISQQDFDQLNKTADSQSIFESREKFIASYQSFLPQLTRPNSALANSAWNTMTELPSSKKNDLYNTVCDIFVPVGGDRKMGKKAYNEFLKDNPPGSEGYKALLAVLQTGPDDPSLLPAIATLVTLREQAVADTSKNKNGFMFKMEAREESTPLLSKEEALKNYENTMNNLTPSSSDKKQATFDKLMKMEFGTSDRSELNVKQQIKFDKKHEKYFGSDPTDFMTDYAQFEKEAKKQAKSKDSVDLSPNAFLEWLQKKGDKASSNVLEKFEAWVQYKESTGEGVPNLGGAFAEFLIAQNEQNPVSHKTNNKGDKVVSSAEQAFANALNRWSASAGETAEAEADFTKFERTRVGVPDLIMDYDEWRQDAIKNKSNDTSPEAFLTFLQSREGAGKAKNRNNSTILAAFSEYMKSDAVKAMTGSVGEKFATFMGNIMRGYDGSPQELAVADPKKKGFAGALERVDVKKANEKAGIINNLSSIFSAWVKDVDPTETSTVKNVGLQLSDLENQRSEMQTWVDETKGEIDKMPEGAEKTSYLSYLSLISEALQNFTELLYQLQTINVGQTRDLTAAKLDETLNKIEAQRKAVHKQIKAANKAKKKKSMGVMGKILQGVMIAMMCFVIAVAIFAPGVGQLVAAILIAQVVDMSMKMSGSKTGVWEKVMSGVEDAVSGMLVGMGADKDGKLVSGMQTFAKVSVVVLITSAILVSGVFLVGGTEAIKGALFAADLIQDPKVKTYVGMAIDITVMIVQLVIALALTAIFPPFGIVGILGTVTAISGQTAKVIMTTIQAISIVASIMMTTATMVEAGNQIALSKIKYDLNKYLAQVESNQVILQAEIDRLIKLIKSIQEMKEELTGLISQTQATKSAVINGARESLTQLATVV